MKAAPGPAGPVWSSGCGIAAFAKRWGGIPPHKSCIRSAPWRQPRYNSKNSVDRSGVSSSIFGEISVDDFRSWRGRSFFRRPDDIHSRPCGQIPLPGGCEAIIFVDHCLGNSVLRHCSLIQIIEMVGSRSSVSVSTSDNIAAFWTLAASAVAEMVRTESVLELRTGSWAQSEDFLSRIMNKGRDNQNSSPFWRSCYYGALSKILMRGGWSVGVNDFEKPGARHFVNLITSSWFQTMIPGSGTKSSHGPIKKPRIGPSSMALTHPKHQGNTPLFWSPVTAAGFWLSHS